MPVEVGDVYFFCMAFDQMEDQGDRMMEMAKNKQSALQRDLGPRA